MTTKILVEELLLRRGTLGQIKAWFEQAVPEPEDKNLHVQLAVHLEEVAEMIAALKDSARSYRMREAMSLLHDCLEYTQRNLKTYEPESRIDFSTVDREDFLDSLCDQQVTSVGLAHMLDLDILGALQHVADSNDSKFDADGFPVFDENQKIIKGPNYFAPDLRPFLNDARYA